MSSQILQKFTISLISMIKILTLRN